MGDANDHSTFNEYVVQKSPIKLHKLSPSKTGQIFFNHSIGSAVTPCKRPLSFQPDEQIHTKVKDIIADNHPKGLFSICGQIEWLNAQREVPVGNKLKLVREAKFYDDTGCINLAVWETLIPTLKPNTPFKCLNVATNFWNGKLKLTTTGTSKFEAVDSAETVVREEAGDSNEITVLCCPEVAGAKLEEYYSSGGC